MAELQIMKGAEPWGAQGDNVGVLVLHGFTGSPQSVRPWAEVIAAEGRTVSVPRLPGHGTTLADMQRTTPADWIAEAEMHLDGLRERCDTIFVCGLSMGGTLTLDLAERHSDSLAGIVLVNTPIIKTDPREFLAPILGKIPLTLKGVSNDIADPSVKELAYPKIPTKAAGAFITYRDKIAKRLGDVRCPALVFISRQDHTVPPNNGHHIFQNIGSSVKEEIWLEKSYHVATLDYEKDQIFERTNRFIKENTK